MGNLWLLCLVCLLIEIMISFIRYTGYVNLRLYLNQVHLLIQARALLLRCYTFKIVSHYD